MVDRELADAQVYIALRRLEEHGLVRSHVEIPLPSKRSRGRSAKVLRLDSTGRRAMESAGHIPSHRVPSHRVLHAVHLAR